MKRYVLSISLISLLFFIQCNSTNEIESEVEDFISEDILSHVISFGTENSGTSNEFLLAIPEKGSDKMCVTNNGDIIIVDEGKIKIFDENGKDKIILGRQGSGPGEFERSPKIFLGLTGYLLAITEPRKGIDFYNLYLPDYSFIDKIRIQNNTKLINYLDSKFKTPTRYSIEQVIPLNENEMIYYIQVINPVAAKQHIVLIHDNNESIKEILFIKNPRAFMMSGNRAVTSQAIGSFLFSFLSENRFVYINTDDDYHSEEGSFYVIHILSLDTGEDITIEKEFNPEEYGDDYDSLISAAQNRDKSARDAADQLIDFHKEKKYKASVIYIKIDGKYLFVDLFSKPKDLIDPDSDEILLDVFNLETKKHITRVIFPRYFLGAEIENGYFITFGKDSEGFYEIQKYKINPIVYGLPEDPDWKTKK